MAQQQGNASALDYVYTLGVTPGIKRDGTIFETPEFTDGVWCRFQRGVPKKVGGYSQSFKTNSGVPRSLITQSINGTNYVYVGWSGGIDVFTAGTSVISGAGPFPAQLLDTYGGIEITSVTNQTTFVVKGSYVKFFIPGTQIAFSPNLPLTLFTIATATVSGTSPNVITTVTTSTAFTGSPTIVYRYSSAPFADDLTTTWQFDVQFDTNRNALQLLAHNGLNLGNIDANFPTPIYAGDILPGGANIWQFSPLSDTAGQNPTGEEILVDGGVVSLYPFIFGYGSNGLIINNHVNQDPTLRTFNDWNGAYANINNISAGKVVRGYPVRGGTSSPSGLFWAIDSLIRVSFNAGAAAGLYWSYDLISSKISVMSSNSIVQADGIFFWMGVDRFYVYNGNVQVLPNNKNLNYLFDNINYAQRQKVWATYIPRYNEIWWFYPRGTATECTDAIIYNTQDKLWYDMGQAVGSRRTCGYTTEVFPKPIWAGWEPNEVYLQQTQVVAQPSGAPAPTTSSFYVAGDQTSIFVPGGYASLRTTNPDTIVPIKTSSFYFGTGQNATLVTLSYPIATSVLAVGTYVWPISSAGYSIWEHETGVDKVAESATEAVYSSFETNDIGWVGGGPSENQAQGIERTMRVVRVEPNFVQAGEMDMSIIGRAYASTDVETTNGPYVFSTETEKIDVRNANFRQLRLKFESNTLGGNYEMGRLLLTADYGNKRP